MTRSAIRSRERRNGDEPAPIERDKTTGRYQSVDRGNPAPVVAPSNHRGDDGPIPISDETIGVWDTTERMASNETVPPIPLVEEEQAYFCMGCKGAVELREDYCSHCNARMNWGGFR